MSLRDQALKIAWACYGLPYIWGGDDAVEGFDCSGLMIEILQSVGVLRAGDWTAQELWEHVSEHPIIGIAAAGELVFWGESETAIRHVEMCIGDGLSIGASGGGRRIKSRADAVVSNAFVKVRPIKGRGNIVGFRDPFVGPFD